ncbi:hypothetical protein M758_9G171500 [Ceratodon purpureus]|uniref:Uncharacterized protein n=1 Tax=Ceratodon purpureus TaxID=3225 RepID=A0A8T0GR43_CERPU|nr:hypothetical protein KC19_9G118800 [Ceratodon purpureus]KAG0606830.1 hypothetical protein M758_9G171500 [Ceratodon purpureus]
MLVPFSSLFCILSSYSHSQACSYIGAPFVITLNEVHEHSSTSHSFWFSRASM